MDEDKSHILIVEDDPDLRTILRMQLELMGLRVSMASNGREGFERAKEILPDLIMLDLMMPEMDGFQVLKRVKSLNSLAQVPVVILTASSDDRHRRKSLSHMADAYLTKPYTMADLEAVVEKFIPRLETPSSD